MKELATNGIRDEDKQIMPCCKGESNLLINYYSP